MTDPEILFGKVISKLNIQIPKLERELNNLYKRRDTTYQQYKEWKERRRTKHDRP